jgi:ribosomal-protein-alanine N-acetyltransferase
MNVLETRRLVLRTISVDDAPFILELLNDPSFLQYIGDRGVRTLDNAREYICNGPLDSYRRFGFGLYLVQLKEDGAPIGICGLLKRDYLADVDLGFAFLPEYRGKGYGYESGVAVLEFGRDVLGLERIVAIAAPDNEASSRLLEKLGMRFEGIVQLPEDGGDSKLFGPADRPW